MERFFVTLSLACLLLAAVPAQAERTRDQAAAELEEVRGELRNLRKAIERDGRRRSKAEKELARVEQDEQEARRELAAVRKRRDAKRAEQRELEARLEREQTALEREQRLLSQQLRIAYINGDEEWLRLVLSQQDTTSLGRRMVYYNYMSRQRSGVIATMRELMQQLELTRAELVEQAEELARLEEDAAEKVADLESTRRERGELVARISRELAGKDSELKKLVAQEAELDQLMKALARVLPAMPDVDSEPFAGQAAKLSWPARGPVLKRFGQRRADGKLKWQGVLLGAPAGSDVQAVYHGRVVFSDWLDGMGLLMIIEHGDGYMSLYGHNQELLREVGEWVGPGDVIAHVGDSGGKTEAGLYFEIRKNGDPVNPSRWVR